jgi:hypothetical protein
MAASLLRLTGSLHLKRKGQEKDERREGAWEALFVQLSQTWSIPINRQYSHLLDRFLHTFTVNYLSLWRCALLERALDVRPLDSFPAFHGTRRFNNEFTRALHLFLSWARPIQSTPPHPTSQKSIIILFTHLRLGLPSGLFPSVFPTNHLYAFLFSPIRATWPVHLFLLDLIILIILGEEHKSRSS